jgi:hypothetical protein
MTVLLFALTVFVFFGYFYPHHLHYQEQYQLFELTSDYAWRTLWRPGGLADYLGGFLTQFYVNSRFGGAIIALLLVGIRQLTAHAIGRRRFVGYALSYWPAWTMLYYLFDENAMLAAPVALAGSLACAAAMERIRGRALRMVLTVLLTPLMYLWWGGVAVVFVAARAVREVRRGWTARVGWGLLAALLAWTACPPVAQYIWPYPLEQFYRGIHYFRFPAMFPTGLWVSAGLCVAVMALGLVWKPKGYKEGLSRGRTALYEAFQGACVWAVSLLICQHGANWDKERVMAYDFFARYQQWDEILKLANEEEPTWSMNITYLNLALGMTGNLPEHQFQYFQYTEECLFPPFELDFTSPLPASEAFYYLGFINTAQRYTFEVQEAIPDGQRSARCYQRLAETALIDGDYPIARKYLRPLLHTMFYRNWARNVWRLTEDEGALEKRPLYSRLRHLRNTEDYLFSDTEIDSMLGRIFLLHKDNRMAFEYLMSFELLSRHLDLFEKYIHMGGGLGYKQLPRSYQEALLLNWTMHHSDFRGFEWQVSPALKQQMVNFINDYNANKPMDYMRQVYKGTYWLFYILETKQHTVD